MTHLTVIAVGRMKQGPMADLAGVYLKRLGPITVIEVEAKAASDPGLLKLREAEAIKSRLPEGAVVVALDERGKILSSPALAEWIAHRQGEGAQNIAFVIGGADGLHESLRDGAALTLAFGAMTWPHMLARVMLLEQLYRAGQILAGHPYHRN